MELKLPWPPSGNHMYLNATRRTKTGKKYMGRILTQMARDYYQEVFEIVRKAQIKSFGKLRVLLTLNFYPPDRRVRDTDNAMKATKDSLTKAGVWHDDSQAKKGNWEWFDPVPGGYVLVKIEEL